MGSHFQAIAMVRLTRGYHGEGNPPHLQDTPA